MINVIYVAQLQHGEALKARPESRADNTDQISICHVKGCSMLFWMLHFSLLQLFKQNLFWFTLAVRLDVMLQVWDNGRDQREEGRFPSLQLKEHPLLIISSMHYEWNLKRAWPQCVGLLVSWRHSAVSHCEGSFSLSRWLHARHHYGLGNNKLCYCCDIQQIR